MLGYGAEGEPAGEGYLASLSDLLVGFLFVFVIVLMAFGLNFRKAEEEAAARQARLQAEIAAVNEQRDELASERDRLAVERDALAEERDRLDRRHEALRLLVAGLIANERRRALLLEQVAGVLKDSGVNVRVYPEQGVLRLPESLLFESGRANLSETGAATVARLAEVLGAFLPCYSAGPPRPAPGVCPKDPRPVLETVLVEGHTDDVPIQSERFADNWDLAARRSVTTYQALVQASPDLARLANAEGEALLGVSAYEAKRPASVGQDEESRRANRRIDIRFVVAAPSNRRLDRVLAELTQDPPPPREGP